MVVLRDYQQDLIDRTDKEFRRTHVFQGKQVATNRSVLVVAPTGAGKTVIFSYIANGASNNGNPVTIVVHRDFLVEQTSNALNEFGVPHDIIAPGHRSTGQLIQVASVNTLVRRLDSWTSPRLLVIDEAHHTQASTWLKICGWLPMSTRILGVTATPERLDGKGLGSSVGGMYDVMVEGPQIGWLCSTINPATGMTYLTQPILYVPPNTVDFSDVPLDSNGEYVTTVMGEKMDCPQITGSVVKHYKRLCMGLPAVAFCSTLAQAHHLAEICTNAGIPAAVISGNHSRDERRVLIQSLETGRILMLISVNLISEGFDLPKIAAIFLVKKTKSLAAYLQMVGRGLRPFLGKENSIICDHAGNAAIHGNPDDDRIWDLNSEKRKKSKSESEISLKLCKKCFRCLKAHQTTCPDCGVAVEPAHPPKIIQEVEGDLVAVISGSKEAVALKRKAMVGAARTYEQLVRVGIELKFRDPVSWARYILDWRKEKEQKRVN